MVEISLTNQADFSRRGPLVSLPAPALSDPCPRPAAPLPPRFSPVGAPLRSAVQRQEDGHRVADVSVNWSRGRARQWERGLCPQQKTLAAGCMPPAAELREVCGSPDGKAIRSLRVVRTRRLPRPHIAKGKRGFRTLRSRTLCPARLAEGQPRDELFHTQEKKRLFVTIFSCTENLSLHRLYGCTQARY